MMGHLFDIYVQVADPRCVWIQSDNYYIHIVCRIIRHYILAHILIPARQYEFNMTIVRYAGEMESLRFMSGKSL